MRRLLNYLSAFLVIIIVVIAIKPKFATIISRQKNINPQALTENYDPLASTAVFNNQSITIPPTTSDQKKTAVLGFSSASKHIDIDLTNQRLYAYEDNRLVYEFPVSSGLWGRTPTGTFNIWVKFRYTKMEGGSRAINTYYYLPNVPYVMFFSNNEIPRSRGYSLHGTYWHDNFGYPMSHGCVNLKTENAEKLYYWAKPDLQGERSIWASANNPGTQINIYGQAAWE